jgi:hypothetical protein
MTSDESIQTISNEEQSDNPTFLKVLENLASQDSLKSRLSVVEMVYHQPFGGPPTTALSDGIRFTRELESNEQPYERHKVAKEEWQQLDCGWIEQCGMLLIKNDEGQFFVNPTKEDRTTVSEKVIDVTYDALNPHYYILPGESMRVCPVNAGDLRIRCRKGTAKYTIYMVPS